MCQAYSPFNHIQICRCPHGTNFVTLGNMTLTLSDSELVLIDRAIHKLAQRHPLLQRAVYEGLRANNAMQSEEVS
jgi:hypothetical protein